MRKKLIVGFFLFNLVFCFALIAQQDPQFSQHSFTKLYYNPGFAGANDAICGTLLYRNQWTGFGGEPKTAVFMGDMPVESLHGGIGLSLHASDKLGAVNTLDVRANYAFRADLGAGKIGVGIGVGYIQASLDGSKFIFNDANDPSIPTGNISGGTYDLAIGTYYNTDKLYVGLSSTHLTENELKYGNINYLLARHYFLVAGYNLDLTSSLTLKPGTMIKYDGSSYIVDLDANLLINNKYWLGAGYRLQDAIIMMAGIELMPNFKLGYSYDLTTSDIKTYNSGSHEIVLNYCFHVSKVVKRQFHRNVRFL